MQGDFHPLRFGDLVVLTYASAAQERTPRISIAAVVCLTKAS